MFKKKNSPAVKNLSMIKNKNTGISISTSVTCMHEKYICK